MRHRQPTRRLAATAVLLCALGLVSGCSQTNKQATDGGFSLPSVGPVEVAADTPALRRAKAKANIEQCVPGVPGSETAIAGGLPEITLPCLGGGPDINLAQLRGPLVINTWGYWCQPCREELPILAAFYAEYGDRVGMLGIDFQDTQPAGALRLARESGVTYPQVFDYDGSVLRSSVLPGAAVPALTFVDAAGKVTAWVPVAIKSEQQLIDLVNEHLGLKL
jgi:thiol-disulfide isomerase/thioredoxin